MGKVVALNRFIARLADRSFPFCKVLRHSKKFEWTPECEQALTELKSYLSSSPLLVKPLEGEELSIYLAVSQSAVSSVLVSTMDKEHRPVYYLSKVLQGAEKNYLEIEKFALALVLAARRLRPYFQSHSIRVLTDQPLKQVLSRPDVSGRLTKWAIELGEFEISYHPRTAIKAQVLANFLLERIDLPGKDESNEEPWILHVDGSADAEGCGVGVYLRSPKEDEIDMALRLDFNATNNESEYEALIASVRLAQNVGAKRLIAFTDSQLVVGHFNGSFEAKEERMMKYLSLVKDLVAKLESFTLSQIPRTENDRADALSKLASSAGGMKYRTVQFRIQDCPSIG